MNGSDPHAYQISRNKYPRNFGVAKQYDENVFDFSHVSDEALIAREEIVVWGEDENDYKSYLKAKCLEREKRIAENELRKAERKEKITKAKNALTYNDKLAQEICERISSGELLISICELEHMPTIRLCNGWLRDQTEFKALYDQSIRDRLTIFEEQIIQISDDISRDYKTGVVKNKERRVVDPDVVARAKLRVEARFRYLKAYKPERWGDSSTLNIKNHDEFDPTNMNPEELEKKIADLESKNASVKAA